MTWNLTWNPFCTWFIFAPQLRLKNLGEMSDIVAELKSTLAKQNNLYSRVSGGIIGSGSGASLGGSKKGSKRSSPVEDKPARLSGRHLGTGASPV